ncbi:hypothetical protein FB451DRAFT_1126977 [Mycena latifolia]|nr:hypothetical protein FB451DRAFT_1126977 [Mycena latifolia]
MESESPFSRYLNTNYAPSDSEVKQIQAHLVPHSVEASRLEALILELSTQRDKILHYIDAHQALLSPVRQMPREIVEEIFLACLPTHRNAVMSAKEAPLVLARVCSPWRTIALTTPALWASLHLPLEYICDHSLYSPVAKWLQLSGQCPLSLSLVGWRDLERWQAGDPDRRDAVIEDLARSSDRWHRIELRFGADKSLLRLPHVYTPKLVAAKITCNGAELLQTRLLTTPSLREVTLRIPKDFDYYIPQMPIRWDHLTHLTFDSSRMYHNVGLSPSTAINIVQRCPRLIFFKSEFAGVPDSPAAPHVSLPALRELIFCRCSSYVDPDSTRFLLEHLSTPQLRHLQLPRTARPNEFSIPFLGDLGARLSLLEELNLDLMGLTQASLVEDLGVLHCLRKLVVVDDDIDGEDDAAATVQGLLEFLGSSQVCPLLRELQVMECRRLQNGDDVLLELARRRLDASGGHFQRLDVDYYWSTPPIAPEVLEPFAARGLVISTSCDGDPYPEQPPPETAWTGLDD